MHESLGFSFRLEHVHPKAKPRVGGRRARAYLAPRASGGPAIAAVPPKESADISNLVGFFFQTRDASPGLLLVFTRAFSLNRSCDKVPRLAQTDCYTCKHAHRINYKNAAIQVVFL